MQVDIGVIAPRELEYAPQLPRPVGIGAGRSADDADAALEGSDQEPISGRAVGEPLLREHTDLNIDHRGEIADGAAHALEPSQIDDWVELDVSAHPRRALGDGASQHAARAGMDILDGETALHLARAADGVGQPAGLRRGAVEHARLVEMDMAFDQAATGQRAAEIALEGACWKANLDRHDPSIRDADIDERGFARHADKARITQDQIHVLAS